MTEIHTYRCDVCGKDFDDKDDCRKHEMEHKTAGLEKSVVMMNGSRKVLPLSPLCSRGSWCWSFGSLS